MQLTKRNHCNPCFWTAYWNPNYYARAMRGDPNAGDHREQPVQVLNVKADKIYETSVENVHYEKYLGIAEITQEEAKGYCKRHFPSEYDQFCAALDAEGERRYVLDFENILTAIEETPGYQTLIELITSRRIASAKDRAFFATFLVLHYFRSQALMNAMIELGTETGIPKFEQLWMLKRFISKPAAMHRAVNIVATGKWTFYRLDRDTFPLSDNAILLNTTSIMVALSPRLLLEIDRTFTGNENSCACSNFITEEKLDEFRRRTIGNTFREIIFGNKPTLEAWQQSSEFRERQKLMGDAKTYNEKVGEFLGGGIWRINTHGNLNA